MTIINQQMPKSRLYMLLFISDTPVYYYNFNKYISECAYWFTNWKDAPALLEVILHL